MTPEQLGAVFGIGLSLILAYVPGIRPRFGNLPADQKQMWVAIGIVLVGVIAFGLSCAGWLDMPTLPCTQEGLKGLLMSVFAALIGNVGTYQATKHIAPYEPTVK